MSEVEQRPSPARRPDARQPMSGHPVPERAGASGNPPLSPHAVRRGRPRDPRVRHSSASIEILGLVLLTAILLRAPLRDWLGKVLPSGWSTIFVAVCVQATPFLVLGVTVSGLIAAFVPASFFTRVMPSRAALAVPMAGLCGAALPGCECGSVPIANRLIARGMRPSAALAFLLSAPAINPIVLIATAVAFQAEPRMVWARLVAGLVTAVVVGWIWERLGRPEWMKPRIRETVDGAETGWRLFMPTMRGDFTQAAGFLVIGAAAAATLQTVVPREFRNNVGSSVVLSIIVMGCLAFVLALCSESDAFVAASFSTIPVVGKLVFLTVGPAVDIKLFAMQSGTFGRRFAVRFAPLTFVVAICVGVVTGLLFWHGWGRPLG